MCPLYNVRKTMDTLAALLDYNIRVWHKCFVTLTVSLMLLTALGLIKEPALTSRLVFRFQ